MNSKRNDSTQLTDAGIPVVLEAFSCSYWGRHQPPRIAENQIVIEIGEGYRSNKHLHGQNLYVLEVNAEEHVALIEMRKYGDLYGSGLWHYLVGVDEIVFVAQVSSNVDTLAEALESLKPAEVKRAEESGTVVQRQGDWFFIPVDRSPRGTVEHNQALDDDHVAADIVALKTVTYVRGSVTHSQHSTIELGETWHKAIQNNAIRTGRLHRRGGAD